MSVPSAWARGDRRALVIGASGVFGRVIAGQLDQAGWEVRLGSRRPDAGAEFIHVDLDRPETVAAAIDGCDVVINTAPDAQLTAERIVLESGGVLINVSAMPVAAVRGLRDEPGPQHGTVMVNAGVAPGLTNLIAADLIARHPDADRIDLVFTVSAKAPVGAAGREFGYRGLTAATRHATIDVTLPEPFGPRRCIGFAESERGWLGQIADGRTVNTYLCLAERRANAALVAINRTGLIRHVPKVMLAGPTPRSNPAQPGSEPIGHRVSVSAHGRTLAARTLRAHGDYRTGAAATALFADALLRDRDTRRPGVFDPDELLNLAQIEPGLQRSGATIGVE